MTQQMLLSLVASVVIFIVLDLLWLGMVAQKLYFEKLSYLATVRDERIVFRLPIGILTQVIIATCFFVVIRLATQVYGGPNLFTIALGGFLGFAMYATYDLTSLSFVKGWPLDITVIDLLWGSAQGAFAGFYIPWILSTLS